jgi:hypothetical protein
LAEQSFSVGFWDFSGSQLALRFFQVFSCLLGSFGFSVGFWDFSGF